MALTYKVLGQVSPAAITNTDLYTTPAATSTVASTLTICNTGVNVTNVRVAVRPAGAALSNEHYIVYNNTVGISDTLFLTIGLSLATTDVVTVYSSNAAVTFNLFGSEIQ
jgi:hypothetical protein